MSLVNNNEVQKNKKTFLQMLQKKVKKTFLQSLMSLKLAPLSKKWLG